MSATVTIGKQGRIVIPAEIRSAADLQVGDQLAVRVEDGRLVLERPADALRTLRDLVAHVPGNRSLVDELLTERREAAKLAE